MAGERVRLPLTIRVPAPSKNLGKRPSGSWRDQRRAWNTARQHAYAAIRECLIERGEWRDGYQPHPVVICDVIWCAWNDAHFPDPDNGIIRTAAARDVLQDIGIVANDKHVQIGTYETLKVRRGSECVTITFRLPADETAASWR